MIRPKRLKEGATIGVISPASPSEKRSEIIRAQETIESWGYKVEIAENVNKERGLISASEEERAADFHEMFQREDIDAVFVTQGGYGSAQIIRHIDFDIVRKNPKIFTGFSDITALHLAINKFCDLVTFHGPGMSRFNSEDLTKYTKEYFFKAIQDTEPIGEIPLADSKKWIHSVSEGVAEGQLTGGNLTLICGTLGTDFAIDTDDKILLIEEVDTEPWIIDHMLCHLRNAGRLDKLKGVVVAECYNCVPKVGNETYSADTCVEDVLDYYLKPLEIPVLYGLPLGHTKDLATLPLGVRVRIDADNKSFEILEGAVI